MRAVVTANLPSREFGATEAFYARLGFEASWTIEVANFVRG